MKKEKKGKFKGGKLKRMEKIYRITGKKTFSSRSSLLMPSNKLPAPTPTKLNELIPTTTGVFRVLTKETSLRSDRNGIGKPSSKYQVIKERELARFC